MVKVLAERKCFASIDFETGQGKYKNVYVMSFGDLNKPDTDVEVEFTSKQLKELRILLNEMYEDDEFSQRHEGCC